jgi:cold shock CspA family protein
MMESETMPPPTRVSESRIMDEPRITGTVTQLFPDRGFGFIRANEGHEFFLHMSNCLGDTWSHLDLGTVVSFVPSTTAKGPRALLIREEA